MSDFLHFKNRFSLLVLIVGLLTIGTNYKLQAQGAIPIASTPFNYTQNFDGLRPLINSGTRYTFQNEVNIPGWSIINIGNGALGSQMDVQDGTQTFPSPGSGILHAVYVGTNVRIGGRGSTSNNSVAYGFRLTNNTGCPLNSFQLKYIVEQWTIAAQDPSDVTGLRVEYNIGNNLNISSGPWTRINPLATEVINPSTCGSGTGHCAGGRNQNGALAQNRRAIPFENNGNEYATVNLTAGNTWDPGEDLFIRWVDVDNTGNDHIYAIDSVDFRITTFTPGVLATNNDTVCTGQIATLTASGGNPGASYIFYSAPTGGTILQQGASSNFNTPALVSNQTYYVSLALNGCTTTPRRAVTAVVGGPPPPTVPGADICGTGTVTLTASGASPTGRYIWYDAPTGGNVLQNSLLNTYTTPSPLTATTNFYVEIAEVACTSARRAVTVNVAPIPPTPTITGPTNICASETASFTTTQTLATNERYLWSTGATTQSISVNTAGTYSLRIVNLLASCTSAVSNTITLGVSPAPATPVIAGPSAICAGETATFTTTRTLGPNEQYRWSNGTALALMQVTTAGNYSLSIINVATNCTSLVSNVIALAVNPLPSAPSITGPTVTCSPTPAVLTTARSLAANEQYLWSNGATTQSINVLTSGTYSLRIRNSLSNCTSAVSNALTVTVNEAPITPTITGPTEVCNGSTVTLTTNFPLGTNEQFLWSNGATTQSITVGTAATYTLRVINTATNCTSSVSNSIALTVAPSPVVSGLSYPQTAYCRNDAATPVPTFQSTGAPNPTLNYTSTPAGLSINAANGQVNLAASTPNTYNIVLTATIGACSSSTGFTLRVNPIPSTPTVTGTTQICSGSTTELTSTLAGAGEGYLWSTGATTRSITVNTAGNYTVRLINASTACSSAVSNTLTVQTLSTPSVSNLQYPRNSFCTGAGSSGVPSFNLTGTGSPTVNFSATPSGLSINAATGEINLAASSPNTYRIRLIARSASCADTAFDTVSINATPTQPTITGQNSFCPGGNATLTTNYTLQLNEAYLWSNGATTQSITVNTAGNYNLKIVNTVSACTSLFSNIIMVNGTAAPDIQTFAYSKPSYCQNEGRTGVPTVTATGIGTRTFSTANTGITVNPTTGEVSFNSANLSGLFTIRLVINNNGCEDAQEASFRIDTVPAAPFVRREDSLAAILCEPENIVLRVTPRDGAAVNNYRWYRTPTGGVPITGVSGPQFALNATQDTVFYVARFNGECESARIPVRASVLPPTELSLREADTIPPGGITRLTLLANGFSPFTFRWAPVDGLSDPLTQSPQAAPQRTTRYTVTATNAAGCEDTISILIVVRQELKIFKGFSPNGDGVNDTWVVEGIENYPANELRIYNRWGNLVFEQIGYKAPFWNGTQDGTELPSGTYYYVLDLRDGTAVRSGSITILK